MTEHEYMDIFLTLIERSEAAGLAFLTVVSGYLIVAYLVGEKLTRGQVILVSALFLRSRVLILTIRFPGVFLVLIILYSYIPGHTIRILSLRINHLKQEGTQSLDIS